jgi:hypothetical protein
MIRYVRILAFFTALFSGLCVAAEPIEVDYDPPQRLDARYRLFKTKNTWNFIELDTQTGRMWQVQFSVNESGNRLKIPLNKDGYVKDGKPGRFTLYPTKNMYNFILLDQDTGKTWQAQWSTDSNQGVIQIDAAPEKADSGWRQ